MRYSATSSGTGRGSVTDSPAASVRPGVREERKLKLKFVVMQRHEPRPISDSRSRLSIRRSSPVRPGTGLVVGCRFDPGPPLFLGR